MRQYVELPQLDSALLAKLFEHVYFLPDKPPFKEEKLADFFNMVKAMQNYNRLYRRESNRHLFGILQHVVNFDGNSEGTTFWLSMAMAIQALYGLSDEALKQHIHDFMLYQVAQYRLKNKIKD